MKIEELHINGWVTYKNKNYKIKALGEELVRLVEIDEGQGVSENFTTIDNIEPIPITEEILKKNSFTRELQFPISRIWFSEDRRIELREDVDGLQCNTENSWWIHVDTDDMRTIGSWEISYVHELQQILSLSKIEKTIII